MLCAFMDVDRIEKGLYRAHCKPGDGQLINFREVSLEEGSPQKEQSAEGFTW